MTRLVIVLSLLSSAFFVRCAKEPKPSWADKVYGQVVEVFDSVGIPLVSSLDSFHLELVEQGIVKDTSFGQLAVMVHQIAIQQRFRTPFEYTIKGFDKSSFGLFLTSYFWVDSFSQKPDTNDRFFLFQKGHYQTIANPKGRFSSFQYLDRFMSEDLPGKRSIKLFILHQMYFTVTHSGLSAFKQPDPDTFYIHILNKGLVVFNGDTLNHQEFMSRVADIRDTLSQPDKVTWHLKVDSNTLMKEVVAIKEILRNLE